jgi:alanine dehydrogenase
MTASDSVLLIPDDRVRSTIDIDLAVDVLQRAYLEYGRERTVLSSPPVQIVAASNRNAAAFKVKGARLPSMGISGFRIIADRKTEAGEETIDYCWVADATTGRVRGLVDETWLHRLRTALTGILAAKWLAKRPVRVATIIGAGKIADELPLAIKKYFDPEEIRVVARRLESAQAFATRHATCGAIKPFDSTPDSVKGADLVFAISSADRPILNGRDLEPGMTICGLGGGPEIAADAVQRANRIIVDDLEYAFTIGSIRGWVESGLSSETVRRAVTADLGELALGTKPGREHDDDIIIAIVQGMACCDLALANLVLSRCGIR